MQDTNITEQANDHVLTLREEQVHLTRTRILNVFESELHARGYDRISIRSLAKLAGMSVSTVCRYYPSKESLLSALVNSLQNEDGFDPSSILASNGEPLEAIGQMLGRMWDYGGQLTGRVKALVESLMVAGAIAETSSEIHSYVASLAGQALSSLSDITGEEARNLRVTVAMLMGPQTWYTLRFNYGLSRDDARAVTMSAITAVVENVRSRVTAV